MILLGIDASLTATGLCAIPADWDRDWRRCTFATYKPPAKDPAGLRLCLIAEYIASFAGRVHATHIHIEDFPRGLHSSSAFALCELHGAIKASFWATRHQIVHPVNISSARRTLLGSLPQGPGMAKRVVLESLRSLGAPIDGDNQADAFAVANHALSEAGLVFLTGAADTGPGYNGVVRL